MDASQGRSHGNTSHNSLGTGQRAVEPHKPLRTTPAKVVTYMAELLLQALKRLLSFVIGSKALQHPSRLEVTTIAYTVRRAQDWKKPLAAGGVCNRCVL